MAKLKKTHQDWKPSENPDLKIGDIVEITDYERLVRTQMAVLVDDSGNEIPLPGESYQCGVCFKKISGSLLNYTEHVITFHSPKEIEVKPEPITITKTVVTNHVDQAKIDELRARRIEILAKARAKRAENVIKAKEQNG